MNDGTRPPHSRPNTPRTPDDLDIYPGGYDGMHRAEARQVLVPYQPKLSEAEYEQFRAFVLERTGLDVPKFNANRLSRGLVDAIQAAGCADLQQFHARLKSSLPTSPAWDHLVSVLTIGETYFFRNTNHFDVLARNVLPELIARRQTSDRRLRIWSAGCATGEEPYSIAILLTELIRNLESWDILILATDINRQALRRAQAGTYAAWSFRGVDKRIHDTYFVPRDDNPSAFRQYIISERIKRMVTFNYLNLVSDPYPSLINNTNAMDIVLCRNVTIYFKPEVTHRVVRGFCACLVDGGWLIPGASEPNMVSYGQFEPRNFPGTVIYQKPNGAQKPGMASPAANVGLRSAPPAPLAATKATVPAPDPYDLALDLLRNGKTDQALAKLHEKIGQNAEFVPAYYTLGRAYANKGNREQARQWCERAIAKDRLRPEPYYVLSLLHVDQGQSDLALDMLKKALYLNREFAMAHYQLAQLYAKARDRELARKSLLNVQRLLQGRPASELVPEGDGMLVGRLLELVSAQLAEE